MSHPEVVQFTKAPKGRDSLAQSEALGKWKKYMLPATLKEWPNQPQTTTPSGVFV